MKNRKITNIILALTITITSFFTTICNVFAEVPQKIEVSSTAATKGYIGETVNFGTKSLKDGSVAYCLDYHKLTPDVAIGTLVGEMDAGVSYLIENGYPNKSFTNDKSKDYYITQIAIWWYLDETTGSKNLDESFKTTDSDPESLRPIIKELVENAKKAKIKGYKNPEITTKVLANSLTMTDDKKYYISDEIELGLIDIDTYTIVINEGPKGSYIADTTGNKISTFKNGDKFRVYVPVESVQNKKTDIKIGVKTSTTINKVYQYSPENKEEQRILTAILYPTVINKEAELTLNIASSKVTITKIDAETKEILQGATLVVKDKDGKIVAEFVTSEDPYTIYDLADGEYEVIETKAPEGYIISEKTYKFTIDDKNREHNITFENYKEIRVPDTNSNSTIMYILGTLIMISGITFVIYNAKKNQQK